MSSPNFNKIPNETTVQDLSNHYVLEFLASKATWIFCPTRREEITLGFDSSLQNSKIGIIQYKSLIYASKKIISIRIHRRQHRTLLRGFPRTARPYVFYSFCDYRNYRDLNDDYRSTGAPEYFNHMIFLDAHSVPRTERTIRLDSHGTLTTYPNNHALTYVRGPEFVRKLKQCSFGNRSPQQVSRTAGDYVRGYALSILRYIP